MTITASINCNHLLVNSLFSFYAPLFTLISSVVTFCLHSLNVYLKDSGYTLVKERIRYSILYVLRTGCLWRRMSHNLPAGKTIYLYFRQWKQNGVWERAMNSLRKQARRAINREEELSTTIIERGFDAGKNLGSETAYSG